jgi:superfamily I DNA/RNA helicase
MGLKNIIAATATAVAVTTDVKTLLAGLNPEQEAAVVFGEGPILVAAVAGAGKTRALVHRVAYLVAARRVNPARILAVTFSKAGADEMNDRLEKMLPGSGARIGTFHSVSYEILRSETPAIASWTVCGDEKFRYCVKDAAGYRELDWKQCDVTLTCDFIGFCKSNMARPFSDDAMNIARERYYYKHGPKADPTMLNRVYERADQIRRDRELLTFDDMMLDAAELLQQNEATRKRWAQRWEWVLQDEAQDQNKVQLVMGELLAKDHRNYLLVGDPAQAIYAWRGAMPSMLLSFEERWGANVVKMGRNYRCGQTIIYTANRVLNSMDPSTKLDMNMICEKGTQGEVLCRQYANLDDEAEAIAGEIAEMIESDKELRSTLCCKDCIEAVRSNHAQAWPKESQMEGWKTTATRIRPEMDGTDEVCLGTSCDCRGNDRSFPEEKRDRASQRREQDQQLSRKSGNPDQGGTLEGPQAKQTVQENVRENVKNDESKRHSLDSRNRENDILQVAQRLQNEPIGETIKTSTEYPQVHVRNDEHSQDGRDPWDNFSDNPQLAQTGQHSHTCERCKNAEATYRVTSITKTQPRDISILYRTNAQSRAPEEALISARIPYTIWGGTNFYNRKEVKDLLAYLRIADGRGSLDDVKRCINAPFRYLGAAFVKKVQDVAKKARAQAKKQGKRVHWPSVVREACKQGNVQYRQRNSAEEWSSLLSDAMERIQLQGEADRGSEQWDAGKPVNVLEDIVLATRYTDWLVRDEGEETTENSRVSNVRELIRAARRFPTVKELLDFIDDLTEASKRAQKGDKPNKVILTTLHRSKGLEWENVFLTGANEYVLPHARSEDIDEERRLFYVGVTRAKERLAISCVAEIAVGDRVRAAFPSPFIAEAGLEPTFMVRDEPDEEVVPTLRAKLANEPVSDGPLFEGDKPRKHGALLDWIESGKAHAAFNELHANHDGWDDDDDDDDNDNDGPTPNAPFLKN